MIFTKQLLSEFVDISKIDSEEIYKKLNSIGLEVDSHRKLEMPKNVVVGELIECQKHPDANKLSVCKVKVSKDEIKQIVCGAENVRHAKFVAVALEGATLHGGLKIKKSELRGVESCGMICSSSELGLPSVGEGIMILDESIGKLEAGVSLQKIQIFNDDVFEIDITPNRGDCLSVYGVARDLSAAFSVPLKKQEFKKDEDNTLGIGRFFNLAHEGQIDISLLYKAIEPDIRYTPLKMLLDLAHNKNIKETNIENFLEYATYLSGVILNGYSSAIFPKVSDENKKNSLIIRREKNSTTSINTTKQLALVGLSYDKELKAQDSGESVIIEASYIHPNDVSKIQHETKVTTDKEIFFRSSRGSNPDLEFGINLYCSLLRQYTSSKIYSGTHEVSRDAQNRTLTVSLKRMVSIIGKKIEESKIISILKNLHFEVDSLIDDDVAVLKVPHFRHDITTYQDVIEEIVRIYGIDNIESQPLGFVEKNRSKEAELFKFASNIKEKAVACGFYECVNFVFSHKERDQKIGITSLEESLELINPITGELNTLRSTLLVNLAESASRNLKNGRKRFGLFEMGSVFDRNRNESQKLAFMQCGSVEDDYFTNHGKPQKNDFFNFTNDISLVLGAFEAKEPEHQGVIFHPNISAAIIQDGVNIGMIGRMSPKLEKEFDLPETFIAEVDISLLQNGKKIAKEFSRLQEIDRDLSVLISKDVKFSLIRDALLDIGIKELSHLVPLDIYMSDDLGDKMSLTIRFYFKPQEKSLEEVEIAAIMERFYTLLQNDFNAQMR